MKNYDDLKQKAKTAIETIADVSVEAYKIAESKAKALAKRAKLNADSTREKVQIRRSYSEIGKKYYELHKDNPHEAFKEDFGNVSDSFDRIAAIQAELEELKKSPEVCDCDCDDEDCCEAEEGAAEEKAEPSPAQTNPFLRAHSQQARQIQEQKNQ